MKTDRIWRHFTILFGNKPTNTQRESERERVKLLLGGDGLNVYTQVVPVGVCGKT